MYRLVCYILFFIFGVEFVRSLVLHLNTNPPRGVVSSATFYPGYLSFFRLIARHADGPLDVFRRTFPLH